MYFATVLTTVRVLPLFLTFSLIRSSTFTVSTFGVRSYSDHRYWSMQTFDSAHASTASELTAGLAAFCTGSGGGGSDKAALPLPVSVPEAPCSPSAVGASACSTPAVAEPRPVSPAATQPARATLPYNAANAASRRGLFTPSLSSFFAIRCHSPVPQAVPSSSLHVANRNHGRAWALVGPDCDAAVRQKLRN